MTGTGITFLVGTSRSSLRTSRARGLLGSRRRYPFRSRAARWLCTVELLVRPNACPISRTEGGYPWASAYRCTNVRISRWRRVRPLPMPRSLRAWPSTPLYEPVSAAPGSIAQGPCIGKHLFVESAFLQARYFVRQFGRFAWRNG